MVLKILSALKVITILYRARNYHSDILLISVQYEYTARISSIDSKPGTTFYSRMGNGIKLKAGMYHSMAFLSKSPHLLIIISFTYFQVRTKKGRGITRKNHPQLNSVNLNRSQTRLSSTTVRKWTIAFAVWTITQHCQLPKRKQLCGDLAREFGWSAFRERESYMPQAYTWWGAPFKGKSTRPSLGITQMESLFAGHVVSIVAHAISLVQLTLAIQRQELKMSANLLYWGNLLHQFS